MSEVEQYYAAITAKWPSPLPAWHEMNSQHQMMFIQGINLILAALHP